MISLKIINKRGDMEFVAICDTCKKEIVNLAEANVNFYDNNKNDDSIASYTLAHWDCDSSTLEIRQGWLPGWLPLDLALESLGKKICKVGVQS